MPPPVSVARNRLRALRDNRLRVIPARALPLSSERGTCKTVTRPGPGLAFQVKFLRAFQVVPLLLGSGLHVLSKGS